MSFIEMVTIEEILRCMYMNTNGIFTKHLYSEYRILEELEVFPKIDHLDAFTVISINYFQSFEC